MPKATTEYLISMFVDSQITATNHSIYEKRLRDNVANYRQVPHCIYFYYWKFHGTTPVVTRYDYDNGNVPIPYNLVEGHITRLARNARAGTSTPAPAPDVAAPWERKSYMVMVMDDPSWRFTRHGPNNEAALVFNPSKGSIDNHSFFDASDMNVDIRGDGSEYLSAVYFVNHMKKNEQGDDLRYKPDNVTRDTQKFVFTLFYDVTLPSGEVDPFSHDPDGTNMGPPIGPPP
jgi:hypothetical protein